MNLTANKTELMRVPAYVTESEAKNTFWFYVLVSVSFILHAFIAYSQRPFETTAPLELLLGAFNVFAIVVLFYGISRLYFMKRYVFLAVSAVVAISFAIVMTVKVPLLTITAGWCTVLLTPVICGHLSSQKKPLLKVYAYSIATLVLFASLQLYPMWYKMIVSAEEAFKLISADLSQALAAVGYTATVIDELMSQFDVFYHTFIRLVPAMTLMAVVAQFSLSFVLFVRWQNRQGINGAEIESFLKWKMPFAATPVLLVAVITHLSGGELMTLIADNLILILAIFYSITGISLLEFFMKKFYVSMTGRVLIYLLLFLSHVIGFALLALLGFVDSFYDWRRKYPLPIDIKTS